MILFLLAAAIPILHWDQGPETGEQIRRAGIEEITVPAAMLDAWRGQTAIRVKVLDLAAAVQATAPGVQLRVNEASATRSPWVNHNGWRFPRSPSTLFRYETPGPAAALAAAEAYVYGARAAISTDGAGLGPLGAMLAFLGKLDGGDLPVVADLGVIDDGSSETGEMMNLLARANLLFRIVGKPDPRLKLNVRLGSPEYPKADASTPHLLAAKIRSALGDEQRLIRIYGSQVVLARVHGGRQRLRLHLLNYAGAQRPVNGIRVRVLGKYSRQQLEADGIGDPKIQEVRIREGATEFTIPAMNTYAVVDLRQ